MLTATQSICPRCKRLLDAERPDVGARRRRRLPGGSAVIRRLRFMRNHLWAGGHLSAYLDHRLGPSEAARIEHHTRACPRCHRLLETLRQTLGPLRELSAGDATPSGLADTVGERWRAER